MCVKRNYFDLFSDLQLSGQSQLETRYLDTKYQKKNISDIKIFYRTIINCFHLKIFRLFLMKRNFLLCPGLLESRRSIVKNQHCIIG